MGNIKFKKITEKTYLMLFFILFILWILELVVLPFVCYSKDVEQAKEYYEQGEYSRCASLCLNLIERDANEDVDIYLLCADSYIAAGDYDGAASILAIDSFSDDSKREIIQQKLNDILEFQQKSVSTPLTIADDYQNYFDKIYSVFCLIWFTTAIMGIFSIIKFIVLKRKNVKCKKNFSYFSHNGALQNIQSPSKNINAHVYANETYIPNKIIDQTQIALARQKNLHKQLVEYINKVEIINEGFHDWCDKEVLLSAIEMTVESGIVNASLLQRKLKISYARTEVIIEAMERLSIISPYNGTMPRKVNRDIDSWSIAFGDSFSEYMIKKPNVSPEGQQNFKIDLFNLELRKIDAMTSKGWEFEQYAADLLLKNGFVKTEVTTGSNDFGVDIIAVDTNNVRYAVQCKCYSGKLNNKSVQEVIAGKAVYNCQVGVVLTNQTFTDNAIELARANGVLLWGREKLSEMILTSITASEIK